MKTLQFSLVWNLADLLEGNASRVCNGLWQISRVWIEQGQWLLSNFRLSHLDGWPWSVGVAPGLVCKSILVLRTIRLADIVRDLFKNQT